VLRPSLIVVVTMAQPRMGASIEELARADRRSADLVRGLLEDD
jgi:hypothetical protein